MLDYEKNEPGVISFFFINLQSIHKINCMQRIKKILMWEVLPAIALNFLSDKYTHPKCLYMYVRYVSMHARLHA